MWISALKFAAGMTFMIGALGLFRWFSATILRFLQVKPGSGHHPFNDALIEALILPVGLVPSIVVATLTAEMLPGNSWMAVIADKAALSLFVVAVCWASRRAVRPLTWFVSRRASAFTRLMMRRIGWLGEFLVATLGIVMLLEIWAARLWVIVASLMLLASIGGFSVSTYGRDVVAGIRIICTRRFRNGDWIRAIDVVEGTVESVGLRTTVVRRADTGIAYVPNSRLVDATVARAGLRPCA